MTVVVASERTFVVLVLNLPVTVLVEVARGATVTVTVDDVLGAYEVELPNPRCVYVVHWVIVVDALAVETQRRANATERAEKSFMVKGERKRGVVLLGKNISFLPSYILTMPHTVTRMIPIVSVRCTALG